MPKYKPLYSLYKGLRESKYDVPDSYASFQKTLTQAGNAGAKSRRGLYQSLKDSNYDVPDTYEDFYKNLFVPVNSTTSRALKIGENPNTPTVNRYRQKMFDSVDPNKNGLNNLSNRAVGQAVRATNNVRKPVIAKVVNQKGKPTGKEFAITPAKTAEDLDREYAQETTKNWENELHDQIADADKDAAKISDMFKSFIGSTDEVGSVWGNMTRGGGIAGTPHSVTTNNGILENTEARQILAAGDYNRKRRELLQLEQDSRNGAIFDNHSFFRGMYDAAKDTGFLTGGASDLINAGSLLATKQDLDNGVHTEAGDMLMQQAVKNSNAQSQYGDNQGWMYTGGVITTNMAPFMVQIGSAGFSKGMSNAIGKVVQGTASKVALGTMEKATGMAGAHIANYIGKVTGLTTKAFGKAVQYGIVGAAQANTVGLGNVANDVINRYTGQVYQDEQGSYKFGTFDSDGNLVHEGGEDFLTSLVKGDAAQTIEFATELAGGGIDAVGTALKNFVTKGGKKIINKYNMENVSKVIDFLLNNKVSKNARYLKAGADRTLGKVELNSIVGESLEEELGIIANTVFTGDNKISDLWDEKQQSQIWGGMLLSIGLMKGAVAPFHAYNAKQYYSYKHKLDKADVNLSQLLGKEKWEELRNQIDATTNDDMPEMVNKINRDVALGKNRQPVREYIQNLLIMRGYDIGNMLAAKKAVEDKGEGVSVKNMEKNQAYQQGRDAYGYDTHEIQLDQEDKQKSLAQLIGISEQQLASMSDEELEALSGRDDNIDRAIYDYQLSTARYEGVIDNARDQIDLEVQRAAQAVDMYTDKSRNTIRNATIKATGGLEDYGVYIINGNIATHEDGSIDISNSDDMILYYDPTTNTVEHADATMFAELGSEENADEVRSQAMADAKEKAIKETTGIIDGVVEVGTQFKTVGADGTEHTYEVLADNGDGTAMITIDGNVPTELVNGESVNIPVSFEELQKMKDEYDQQRLQAAKAEREQMVKERAVQQTQETEQTQPSFDFNQILNDNGNVVLIDVLDKDGNTKYPDSRLFLIRDAGAKAKVVELKSDGTLVPHAVNKEDVATISSMSLDEYKQAMPESSMIEDNSGEESDEDSQLANLGLPKGSEIWMSGDGFGRPKENTQSKVVGIDEHGSIILEDKDGKKWSASFDYINNHRELPPLDENTNIVNEENNQSESNAEENTPAPEQTPAMTLEDGTIVPMLEDGNPDFSKLTAAQTAELYDTQFGEDADSIVSGYVSDAKKALDKASNMTVKGKTFVEQKAAKDAKEKAIADAQAAYDSAIAIRDAYNERQLAKVEDTAEGRKELIEKARRKFARLKSAVKDDAEAVSQLYRETIGSLLHRLYDSTGIDVSDTTPLTAEEYVASNLGAHSLNYEGTETSKGVKQETGLSREDFAKTQLLAADGKGITIDNLVHSLWENRPSNLESLDTQDIRNALIGVLTSGFKASEARNFVENIRIAQAENILEEQKRAQEDAAYSEQHKAEPEAELKAKSDEKAELKAKSEAKLDNESDNENINDNINDNINTPEVPEDATDENPLGLQLSEDKVPFEIEGGKSGETYDINDNEDRQRLINDNKVDDKDILDIDMPKHVHKAIKELCKKMGLKVQFLYMGARSNGWIENGTMYLALDTEKATQFVFGHEMTHAIKQKNPEAYKELVKVAMAVTTKKKFEEDLAKVYQNYHGISGYNNVDDYVEEVVADNLGKFINDFDLAQKFSLRLNHPVLGTILHAIQKIKSLLYGDFYKSVDALERIVEKAYVDTAKGEVTNSETGEDVSFSLRQKPEPKKKGIGYKVFVLKDGKLYPPMVANPDGAATPVGVWLDADAAPIAGESKTGRPQVKQGGKGTQGGSGKLAYRPGWHLGVVPYAIQFNRKDAEGNKTLFPKNFVFAEVEYAADVDYQEEARQEGINPSGKYQHSLAGLKHLPTDGYYMYRTNPNPETDPWVITGAMKVNRILTRAEQAELVKNAGREPQQIQEGDIVTDDVVNSINQEIADAPKFSLKVYHGSGADFTEFDFDHMGEGAGSQVFGWGGYVTSSKKIGKSYANIVDANAPHQDVEYVGNNAHEYTDVVAGLFNGGQRDYDDVKEFLLNGYNADKDNARKKQMLEWFESTKPSDWKSVNDGKRNLYEVDIPDDNGSNYLEWEKKPSDEVATKIIEGLYGLDAKTLDDMASKDIVFRTLLYDYIKNADKEQMIPLLVKTHALTKGTTYDNGNVEDDIRFVYNRLSRWMGSSKAASQFLSSLGFTGIKYPAGTIMGGAEEDDTNYVIFKPEDMRITEHTKFSLRLKSAIEETETNPSDAQKESGNYKKGHVKFGGYDYTIENPKGSTRSGKDADGKEWKVIMHDTYGYIRGKFGKDGDHLDMFINDKADLDNWNGDVFVVDQVNPDGSFDEHKVMYGYDSMDDAKKAYLANYSDGWQGLGDITGVSKDEFDKWLDTSKRKLKPFKDYAKVKFSLKDIKPVGVGAFGNIYNQFRGNAKAAIEFLKKVRGGEAVGALHHKDIGDIDLVWGKEGTGHSDGYGLSKLVKYHPEVLDDLQEILNDMRVVSSSKNRVNLESETHKAGVRLTWDGERKSWLLTAFKKETSASDKRTDTAATSLEGDTALSQTEGSAAKIDNSSETTKENGEKFSLKDEKTLAGVHNISEEKLLKAIKQGGLANPSVAVIDSSKQDHKAYGGISLIMPSDKIAKRTGKNAGTWQGDAYTPTYPQVERQMSNKGAEKASKDVSSVSSDMYSEVRRGLDRWLDGGEANSAMAYMFLHEKGVAPEPKKIQPKFSDEAYNELKFITAGDFNIYGIGKADAQKVLDMYIEAKFDGDKDLYEEKTKAWLERNKSIVDAGAKGGMRYAIAKENVELYDEYGFNYKGVQTFVRDVEYDHRKSGVDTNATLNDVEDYIKTNNLTDEFNTWLEGKEKKYGIKEVIFDGFTPSGNRRYVPNTLENVSKIMKKQGRNGATGAAVSFQNFAARLMPSYGTLKDIRSKKGLLTSDREKFDKFRDKWSNVFFELGNKCQPDSTSAFDSYGMERLSEAAMTSDPQAYLKKVYNVDFSDEDTKRLKEMVKAIKEEHPAMYFETKFERPVRFDEFSSAVVPTTTKKEVKEALKNAGVSIFEYDEKSDADRKRAFNEAINSSDNIRFSLKSMKEKPEGWKQANKKAIHIAEAIERDPKFSLKNLDGTLIKAGTYFSGGGLVEEGLKGIIDPVVAVEYDEKISGVYRNNFGQHIVTADVRDVDPKELVKQIDGEVEYFHASPVCKNYSQAKSNHAEVELDKETAASTAEFINAVKPKVVTIENVKGYKDSDAMKTITDALDANGYTWDADVYNAADYGGYTNRERLIVRAVRDGKLPAKPKKMAHKSGWYEVVADIIPTLTEKKNGVAPWMDIRLKADGIDWRNIDKPLYVMGSAYADGKIPHAFADELLPTLRTKSGDVIVMPDGKVFRAMGRVLARVSGVSDDYKMPFSENLSHTIIGNGIPTQLTEHVIAPLLTGSDPKFSIRTYHGTGAKFDKFDLSHALEGEGSETFGHGVYVTNSKEIGTDYAQRAKDKKAIFGFEFVNPQSMSKEAQDMLRHYIYKHQDVAKGLENARKDLKDVIGKFPDTDYLQELNEILAKDDDSIAIPSNRAYRYDVDIPDDNGSNYLGWNESQNFPLEKWYRLWEITHEGFNENEYFKDGGARYDIDRIERITQMKLESPENGMQKLPTLKGEELYHALEDFFNRERPSYGAELASRALSEIGFVGIKYPAGMIHGGAEEGDYNYVIFDENNANIVGNTKFSLRYDKFEHDLNQWKKDNSLPKDAQRPTIPQRNAGESAVDFLRRVDEYRKQMALWKTAPTYEQHLLSDDTALGEFNRELQRGSVLKRIAFQDSMLAIRKAQEAIMKEVGVDRLNMAEDAYTAENRSHGKGKNEFEEYNNEFLQPLRKAYHQMKKVLGDSYDNVRIYMMAKHGLERDAQMAFKKSLEADYEDVAQRSAAYKAYKGDMNRIINDSDLEFGRVDFTTWRQRDNALRAKYSPSYMDYRYDKNGIVYDYSGLSALFGGSDFEEAAHKLVRDIESNHVAEVHDLWDATNAATKKILRDGYKAGMMNKDTYQYVRDMYSHYIPLRGWDGTTADQVWDYIGGGKGAFNQTLKKAHGRTSIADDPIAYIENMAESGILLNNKNWVKQHLMLLAQNHPTSLLTLSKAWYVKSVDDNGNEEWIPATPQITSQMNSNQVKAAIDAFEKKMEQMAQTGDATQKRDGLNIAYPQTHSEEREHEVRVMKNGEEYVIYVNGDPQLAQAMNNTRAHRVREIQSGKLDRAAAWLGRKMAAAYTSLSPLFIPSNYFRDLTMTLASTAIREDAKYNYLLIKNLATSWNLGFMLRDYQSGKLRDKVNNGNATPKEQMFYDFMMNGGETGFVSSLDVEDLKKKFKNDLKDLDRWKTNPVKVGHTIMDGIEFLNRAIEDSNRFAVYMTSIQYGRSIDEAVNDAKDVTLNFNRKGTGEYGWQMIRNLYLFINPAVQSLQTLGALAKHHPFKFTAVTASWLASGVLVPIVNAALMSLLGGDDDKDKYWQFTKWDRRNNFIMWIPTTHEFVKIPLAQEFRAFYGVGDMIASKMMGGELAEESWSQYAEDLLGQVVDMLPLDPTGYDGNIAVSLMPNAIRPVFELAFNVDFTGKPLFKETEYNKYDPNFTKAYVGTPDWLVRISRMVNSIGNDYPDVQQNSIDAFGDPKYNLNNPAVVDHVLSSYLGGAYTMGSQVLGLLTKSLNDRKEIKVADIPLFSKFVSNPDDRPVSKKQGDEFWDKKEYYDRASNTISKLKKQAKIDGDYSLLERFYGSEEYKTYKLYEKDVKDYKEARKKERAEESGDEYRPHQLNAEDIYNNHATPMDEFEDMKLKQLFEKLNSFKTRYDAIVDNAPNESDGYYNTNKAAIDAIDEISLDKQEISELKKGFLDDGKDVYNAEDMKQIRDLRKKILAVLEKANKVVVANQKAKIEK
jgi:hypothetical protein